MPENELTVDYFFQEYHRFRKEMGLKTNTIEQKLQMFQGLVYVYFNVKTQNPQVEQRLQTAMSALQTELEMRLGYESMAEVKKILQHTFEN